MDERRQGFTLIEIVGAFFMMVVILTLITGIFIENGRQRSAATELMRERLSIAATLDLMGNDLEGAIFVAQSQDDEGGRSDAPWRVLASGGGELGADALRFVTQNAPHTNLAEHSSGWVEVAYFLEEDERDGLVLWRWLSARPPSEASDGFPDSNDPGSMRLAVGVSEFGVRFMDAQGNWLDEWDSSYLPPQQALPEAAEISLSLFRKARRGEVLGEEASGVPGRIHVRRVSMVMEPIDVAALIALATPDGGELDCFTISDCLALGDNSDWWTAELDDNCGGDDDLCSLLDNPEAACWRKVESDYPQVAAQAAVGCES